MTITVRPGQETDLDGIVEIYNHYVVTSPVTFEVEPVHPKDRQAWVTEHTGKGKHRLFVAVDRSGMVQGWATTSPFRPRAAYATTVEASVYCHHDSRGQGIGSQLYEVLFRSIANEDLERIVAGITLPNTASVRLHTRFGFRPVGVFTRVGRKLGRFWDVGWFERPLDLNSIGPL